MAQIERKKREAETGHFTETGDGAQAWTKKTNNFDKDCVQRREISSAANPPAGKVLPLEVELKDRQRHEQRQLT